MGCLNNFVDHSSLLESGELEEGDIIEFNRRTYSHFGIYIGHEICVNVTGPEADAALSSKIMKGMKVAQRLRDIAGTDPQYNKVRVNNCEMLAVSLFKPKRPKAKMKEIAVEGLELDTSGNVLLDAPIPYDYNLVRNNCEYFATRCRYECDGFSLQVTNFSMNSTLGTVERVTSARRSDMVDILKSKDSNVGEKTVAALNYGAQTTVGWTAYAVKTTTDAVAAVTSGVFELFKS